MIGQQIAVYFWQVPTGQVRVDAVHESRVVTHFRGQRTEKVPNALLMLHVHFEVPHHDNAAIRANTLLPAAELAGLHVALHDVHAIFLIEGDARDFIEADDVVLANQSALTIRVVDEHSSYGGL